MSGIQKVRISRAWSLFSCIALVACQDTDPWQPPLTSAVSAANVTGDAAAALGSGNQFALASPASLNGEPIISPAQARRLALAFLRTFGASYRAAWEADRGASIDLATLGAASRVYFDSYHLQRVVLHGARRWQRRL